MDLESMHREARTGDRYAINALFKAYDRDSDADGLQRLSRDVASGPASLPFWWLASYVDARIRGILRKQRQHK